MTDLESAIRERLEELRRRADLVAIGLEDAVDALTAVFDRHKPGYPDGPEYEEHDEPVFDRAGAPQGHVRVKGDPIPGHPENWPIGVKPTSWEQVYESVLAGPSGSLWWLSFTDPDRAAPPGQQVPGGGGFLGVAICEGDTLADAITRSHLLGVNPGGQIAAKGPLPAWMIAAQWRDRLLTKEQALSIPDPTGGGDD